ncbi:hypothetical protein Tco_1303097 [Tanacetum coccineum]
MAVLESCAKHNMVAYLEKTDGNTNFHEIIDFLTRSSIHYALTVSPVVSTTFVEQFWMSAKSKIINNVRYITVKVAGKPVNISKASIRSDLLFDDADGLDFLHNQAIFDVIQQMGHLDAKKKFVMYPRFILVFLDKQLNNVLVPLDHFPINALTIQPTEDEGKASKRQSEPQPTPSPPHPKGSSGNHRGQSSSDRSISRNEDGLTLQSVYDLCVSLFKQCIHEANIGRKEIIEEKVVQKEFVSKQGRKPVKSKPTMHKYPAFDDLDDVDVNDVMDYMETNDYIQKGVSTEDQVSTVKPDEGTDKSKVSTDKPEVSTAKPKEVEVSTDKLDEGTAEPKDGTSYETKQKGVKIKDAEDSDRPRATSTRSVLTLKPLPKIDPKDKGKKVLEEEAESAGVDEAERKFDQLAKDEKIARKV